MVYKSWQNKNLLKEESNGDKQNKKKIKEENEGEKKGKVISYTFKNIILWL